MIFQKIDTETAIEQIYKDHPSAFIIVKSLKSKYGVTHLVDPNNRKRTLCGLLEVWRTAIQDEFHDRAAMIRELEKTGCYTCLNCTSNIPYSPKD